MATNNKVLIFDIKALGRSEKAKNFIYSILETKDKIKCGHDIKIELRDLT